MSPNTSHGAGDGLDFITSEEGHGLNETFYYKVAPILFYAVALFIFLGNILTIAAVFCSSKLRTLPNMYIVCLASADLMTGVYVFLWAFLHVHSVHDFLAHSKIFCIFLYIMFVTSNTSSSISMTMIAFDRFMYIVYPFRYSRWMTVKSTKYSIFCLWTLSVSIGLCTIYFNSFDNIGECLLVHVLYQVYQLMTHTGIFFATFIANIILYGKIIHVALQQRSKVAAVGYQGNATWKNSYKTIRLFVCVCFIYFSCWMPTHLLISISLTNKALSSNLTYTFLFGLLNSGTNFILYPLMNKDFRFSIKSLIFRSSENRIDSSAL